MSASPYRSVDRYKKAATAFVAIAEVLESENLSSHSLVFKQTYQNLLEADPKQIISFWNCPFVYFWIRAAYELLRAITLKDELSSAPNHSVPSYIVEQYANEILGTHDPRQRLFSHLDISGLFQIPIAIASNSQIILAKPARIPLPIMIPGTDYALEQRTQEGSLIGALKDSVQLIECSGSQLVFLKDGTEVKFPFTVVDQGPINGLALVSIPRASHASYSVPLQPYACYAFSQEERAPLEEVGLGYQAEKAGLISAALELVEKYHPQTYLKVEESLTSIALKPLCRGSFTNASNSHWAGGFIVSVIENPYEMADTLIHEYHHDELFCIEEEIELLDQQAIDVFKPAYYSSVRDDPRPLQGILHALYVYLPVAEYWLNVYQGRPKGIIHDYAGNQAVRILLQIILLFKQLERFAIFSSTGLEHRDAFESRINQITAQIRHFGLSGDCKAMVCKEDGQIVPERPDLPSVIDVLKDHIERFSPESSKVDLLADLQLAAKSLHQTLRVANVLR